MLRLFAGAILLFLATVSAAEAQPLVGICPSQGNCSFASINGTGATRANVLSVTQRDPLPTDYAGYSVGSLWHGATGWWQASRVNAVARQVLWTRLPTPSIAGSGVGVYGTRALFTNSSGVSYSGNLFTLTRMSDLTTQTFSVVSNGLPDTAAMAAFCSQTICRYTTIYDQSGNGNHATQATAFSWAPRYDGTIQSGGAPGAVMDGTVQGFLATYSSLSYAVSAYTASPNTVTLSAAPTYPIEPGWTITGSNIPTASAVTGTISGTTLTTTAVSGTLAAGEVLFGAAPGTKLVSLTSGSGNAQVWTVSTSQTISSATTFNAQTLVTAVNAAGTLLTLSSAPTGTGNVLLAGNAVGLDLPSGMTISAFNAQSAFALVKPATLASTSSILTIGATAQQVNNAANGTTILFQQNQYNAFPNGMIFSTVGGGSSCGSNFVGNFPGNKIQVVGYVRGSNYFNYYDDTQSGSRGPSTGCQATTAISGGSIGYSQQFTGVLRGSDFEFYGAVVYNRTLTAAEVAGTQQALTVAYGLFPQVVQTIVFDGSSTTAGTGTDYTNSQPNKTSALLWDYYPNIPLNSPSGGTAEVMLQQFPWYGASYYSPAGTTPILVVHPGLGNSMQTNGTVPVTAGGNTATMTVNTVNSGFMQGAYVTGGAALPNPTQILFSTATSVTLAAAPNGTVTTLTALNDCGSQAWANVVSYLQLARAAGYKIVLVGSASRGTFAGTSNCGSGQTQLQEFQNAKALMFNHWQTYADAYVDLQDDPAFGDAAGGGAMAVTAVSGNVVTVSSVSADAAVGSYVKYAGMPDQGVTITAIAGNNITLSATPPAGLTTLNAINIAPWTANPSYWLATGDQHFMDIGYEAHAHMIAPAVLKLLSTIGQ